MKLNKEEYRLMEVKEERPKLKRWLPQFRRQDGEWESIATSWNGIWRGMYKKQAIADLKRHAETAKANGVSPAQAGRKYA